VCPDVKNSNDDLTRSGTGCFIAVPMITVSVSQWIATLPVNLVVFRSFFITRRSTEAQLCYGKSSFRLSVMLVHFDRLQCCKIGNLWNWAN